MSIFGKFLAVFSPKNAAPQTIGSAEIRRGDGVWEALTGNGAAPSEHQAMQITAVTACVQLISGAISAMPMHVYTRDSTGDLNRDTNNPLWWMLNEEFCPRWAASAGWSYLVQSKLLHGDGFAEILRDPAGKVRGLVPIHPYRVQVIATPDGSRLVYRVGPDLTVVSANAAARQKRTIDQDDMLHVAGFGFNGLRGMSALRNSLAVAGNLAISAQDFSNNFLTNLGRPDFALEIPTNLTDAQFSRLQDNLDSHTGTTNGGKPMILEGGMKINAITMPLEEMQLLETRKFQVEEICRAFGVPPSMIGHSTLSTWGSGVEAMGLNFVKFALRDHLNAFQNEINRKFFRTAARVAEFDTAELERADLGTMMTALRTALGRAGEDQIMSVEEVRAMLRLPRQITGTVRAAQPAVNPGQPIQADPQEPPL